MTSSLIAGPVTSLGYNQSGTFSLLPRNKYSFSTERDGPSVNTLTYFHQGQQMILMIISVNIQLPRRPLSGTSSSYVCLARITSAKVVKRIDPNRKVAGQLPPRSFKYIFTFYFIGSKLTTFVLWWLKFEILLGDHPNNWSCDDCYQFMLCWGDSQLFNS